MEDVRYFKDEKTGIKVQVKRHKNGYDVKIIIPSTVFKETNKVYTTNKDFTLYAKGTRNKHCVITLNGSYKKVKYGLIENLQTALKFKTDEISGSITLNPRFYIPNYRRATPKKIKKIEDIMRLRSSKAPNSMGLASTDYTQYTHTNIRKPFGGGGVSSK